MSVERWAVHFTHNPKTGRNDYEGMVRHSVGAYVAYADYKALTAELEALRRDAECLRMTRERLPTKVESAGPWGGMTPEEVAAFDSGYNAALNRAHLLLMASLAPANECPSLLGSGHLMGAGDAAISARQQEATNEG